MKRFGVSAGWLAVLVICLGQVACRTPSPQPLVHSPLILPLVALVVRPDLFSSGQQVIVEGFLSHDGSPLLFLTSEHAAAFDTSSAIRVSDPTPDGSLTLSDCMGKWVAVHGVFIRHTSGEVTIRHPTRVVYRNPEARSRNDWSHANVVCWASSDAA